MNGRSVGSLVKICVMALATFGGQAAHGALTTGALVDLDAQYNATAGVGQWTNNGTLGGKYSATGTTPNLTDDGTNTYYSSPTGSTWGTNPAGANNPAITGISNFSLELWLKRPGPGTGAEHQVFGMSNATGSQYVQLLFREGGDNDSIMNVNIDGNDGVARNKLIDIGGGSAAVPDNVWEQVVVTYNNSSKAVSIYLNSVLVGTVFSTQDMQSGELMNVVSLFKADPGESNSRAFNGLISRFRLYDFDMTQTQIGNNFVVGNTSVPEPTGMSLIFGGSIWILRRRSRCHV